MRSKIRLFFIIFLSVQLDADSFKYNFINKSGIIGLINMPTARSYDEASAGFTYSYAEPDPKSLLLYTPMIGLRLQFTICQ